MSDATVYRIRLRGDLGPEWSAWFHGVEIQKLGDGTCALIAHLPDQAALHGLLDRVRDLGLEIVAVDTPANRGGVDDAAAERHNSDHAVGVNGHQSCRRALGAGARDKRAIRLDGHRGRLAGGDRSPAGRRRTGTSDERR